MIASGYYYDIYLFIVAILTFIVANQYYNRKSIASYRGIQIDIRAVILFICCAVFIGFRPTSGFGDTFVYYLNYTAKEGLPYIYDPSVQDAIWNNIFDWWASEKLGISNFFFLVALLYFGGYYLSCRKLFNQNQYIAFLVFLGSFSTFSYATNGIRAGAAAAIFLLGISYYRKLIICIPLVLISWGIHHSMTLPVTAFVIAYFYRNLKFYYYIWAICVFLSAAHITYFQTLFASMAEEQGDLKGVGYLVTSSSEGWGGQSGFRFDFVLYSAMPLLVGYYALFKKKLKLSGTYKFLLSLYIIANSAWMLCMYTQFNNRIAYLSWFMFPIVLIYPFVNENWGSTKLKTLSKVVLANLAFTLLMHIIYY